MYTILLKDLLKKYKFLLLALLFIIFVIIFLVIKTQDDLAKDLSLDEETAEPQISSDIDCETLTFLDSFSAQKSELICLKLRSFISSYNETLKDDEEYVGFTYVNDSFADNSFKIKSSTNDEYKITIHDSKSGLFLSSNPQLHSRS